MTTATHQRLRGQGRSYSGMASFCRSGLPAIVLQDLLTEP